MSTAHIRATRKRLEFMVPDRSSRAVDILLNESRVWSTRAVPDEFGWARLHWPRVLRPYLHGRTTLVVRDSATGEEVASGYGRLGSDASMLSVTDSQGRRLAVNKWSRLSHTFDNANSDLSVRALDAAERLAGELDRLGVTAYLSSGTLLGAIRTGLVLPHDDDVDFGVLATATHPSDIVLEGYALENALRRLGYTTFRHSGAHLQLQFADDQGEPDFYIDIFTGFFRGGTFNQPFHLRQAMPRSAIAPTATVQLEGRSFAAPGDPERWLRACYGAGWRTPDPTFRFVTPASTRHRFDSWFGVMDGGSEKSHSGTPQSDDVTKLARSLAHIAPKNAPTVYLRCGPALANATLRAPGRRVLATDSDPLVVERAKASDGVTLRTVNPSERRRMLELGADLVRDGAAWWIVVVREFEHLTAEARDNVLLLGRLALEPDGRLVLNVSRSQGDEVTQAAEKLGLYIDSNASATRVPGSVGRVFLTLARH